MDGALTADLLGPLNATEQTCAPERLWLRGDRGLLAHHPRVAVVGTRHPSDEGKRRTRKLVRALVDANVVIVSGLARGIDTIAHTEALARGGRTIAVIGTPIDRAYPSENAALQQRISESELLVSEFAPGSVTSPSNFPRRNRTMALIADASVIIEAGAESGVRSQGWATLRLGRPLFLLKSLVDSGVDWPTRMVEHGAIVLHDMTALHDALSANAARAARSL